MPLVMEEVDTGVVAKSAPQKRKKHRKKPMVSEFSGDGIEADPHWRALMS